MTHFAACQNDSGQIHFAIRAQAIKCLKKTTEEEGMFSSSGDVVQQMWNVLESQTSSAMDWIRKCYPVSPSRLNVPYEKDYGPIAVSETGTSLESYFEREEEVIHSAFLEQEEVIRSAFPEKKWKPIKTKIIMVKKFQLNLEP
jgi:hypothetical protein